MTYKGFKIRGVRPTSFVGLFRRQGEKMIDEQ